MHIYMINIDAAPLFDSVSAQLAGCGFRHSDIVVNGAFTLASIKAMYYGKVYDRVGEGDPFLIDMLLDAGYSVELHGGFRMFISELLGEEWVSGLNPTPRGRLATMCTELNRPEYADILVSSGTSSGERFRGWNDGGRYQAFMQEEAALMRTVQAMQGNALTHMTWSHYHDFVYYFHPKCGDKSAYLDYVEDSLIDWLRLFDFDESNALFLVFSDHGDYVNRLTPPKDYWRWCFIKDTTADPVEAKKLITGIDVFRLLIEKAGLDFDFQGYDCRPLDAPPDHDRIYHLADTRYWDKNRSETTLKLEKLETREPIALSEVSLCMNASAVKIIEWDDDQTPAGLLQATYYRHTQKYYFLLFRLDLDDPLYRYGFFDQDRQDKVVIRSLAGLEELRPHLIELCQSLTEGFDWIQNRDFRGQIDRDEFPAWLEP